MRDDNTMIRLIFKINTSGIIDTNKCDPLLSSYYRGLWPYFNDTALASQSLGLFLLPCHLSPGFETCTEDGYYFIATPWIRSAMVFVFSQLWPVSYLSDSAWYDFWRRSETKFLLRNGDLLLQTYSAVCFGNLEHLCHEGFFSGMFNSWMFRHVLSFFLDLNMSNIILYHI